ncbi:putative bifunctional diguanylate cyclase/phosphodiesterase [Saccharopolyspora sp. CA-218241]|uniref:putative bifunctional diguanylate cyclase/phosphodiesterase n=1 Tax=Saccharopolyspora sp. CA-218241 TaxID=3240027 RepID=UPI003D98BD3F
MTGSGEPDELTEVLGDMARDLLAQGSVQRTLDRIVQHAVRIVDGCEHAGIMAVPQQQGVRTLAATSELARRSDLLQGELGEGPCFDALHDGRAVYRIADLGVHSDRWPRYTPRARELGIGSMMGFLLFTESDNLGALNFYSSRPNAFTERSEHVGLVFAAHAAVAFSSASNVARLGEAIETGRQRFSELLSLAPVGVALFDEDDRIRDANEALGRLTGYAHAQLLGMRGVELLHPRDRGEGVSTEAGREHGTAGPSGVRQRTLVRHDGEPVICEVRYAVSPQDGGERFWLVSFQDVTARSHQAESLQHQATHDVLTGLPNRRGVEELLRHPTEDTAVLFADIDNFKRVNDSLGHAAGDELIVQVAQRLRQAELPGCTVARLSGDEFLIICTELGRVGGLQALAERVSGILRMTATVRGHSIRVSASVGAAEVPAEPVSGEDLLRYADAAMFTAKRQGPGRLKLAEEDMLAHVSGQVQAEGDLTRALRDDALELHYQPIVDGDRVPVAVEALVRWPHPERGMLSPAVILPTAEQAGLLHDLDRWIVRRALQDAAGWPATPAGPVQVWVNLTNQTASDCDFLTGLGDTLARSGIEPHRLVLEITEMSLLDPSEATRDAMRGLIDQGVSFAVDDFGTGYSSLGRLKDLPIGNIKLDRQFAAGIEDHEFDRAIVRSTVDMAHAAGLGCVAEGVETTTQFRLLVALGIDAYQGFLFSRPLPDDDLRALLGERAQLPRQR